MSPGRPTTGMTFASGACLDRALKTLRVVAACLCIYFLARHVYSAGQDAMRTAFTSSVASVTRLGQSFATRSEESGAVSGSIQTPLFYPSLLGRRAEALSVQAFGFHEGPPALKIQRSRISVFPERHIPHLKEPYSCSATFLANFKVHDRITCLSALESNIMPRCRSRSLPAQKKLDRLTLTGVLIVLAWQGLAASVQACQLHHLRDGSH